MNAPQGDGRPLRAHLHSIWRQKKQRPAQLDGPPFPEALAYVWSWYLTLAEQRPDSFMGLPAIGFGDIADWARLTGNDPTPYEVECILALDRAERSAVAERRKKKTAADKSRGKKK